jgi:uncharacterized protein (DUF1810 family)
MCEFSRFMSAQSWKYACARSELTNGRKETHWMWYMFPQLAGLGRSDMARHFGIAGKEEATQYAAHPVLGKRLVELSEVLLRHDAPINAILGSPDDLKLRSCMTLFSCVPNADSVFGQVLDKFFGGKRCHRTLDLLGQ